MLWCDGLKAGSANRKRKLLPESDSDSGEESNTRASKRKKDKEVCVQKIVDDLKQRHGEQYTMMQFRIWAVTVNGGMHSSLAEPPSNSMFNRAGGASNSGGKKSSDAVITAAVSQITSALTPKLASLPAKSDSPAKVIENRSRCYRQLTEVKNLWESGLLSKDEYAVEREAIMNTLQKLSGRAE